jgi:hypothetical protein
VSISGGSEPLWSHSGSELYYRTPTGSIVAVGVTTAPTFALSGQPRVVLSGRTTEDFTHQNYDVSPDGKFVTVMPAGPPSEAILVHNWKRELREKLASGAKK